ncbi:MAG: hypothetical protein ACK5L6_10550 [Anaerorhabdus sp.]|uniref:hypothetical protein n=1 Tax=Anaerorhabdus sp. TaxID=1872524 RepID=UPI003A8558E5
MKIVDCNECINCTGKSCVKYGDVPSDAIQLCVNDGFKNYKIKKSIYRGYNQDEITLELLNSLVIGDKVKINNWKQPLTVKGISENFVIMNRRHRGDDYIYSIIEKKKSSYRHNGREWNDIFICGPDDIVFGSEYGYAFNNQKDIEGYLNDLETGNMNISYRNRVAIEHILIKRFD